MTASGSDEPSAKAEVLSLRAARRARSGVRAAVGSSPEVLELMLQEREVEAAIHAEARELHAVAESREALIADALGLIRRAIKCAYVALWVRDWPDAAAIAREPLPVEPDGGVAGLGLSRPPRHLVGECGEGRLDPTRLVRVPIVLDGEPLGELRLHGGSEPLSESDRARAGWLAEGLAGPILTERWAHRARRFDPYDPVTGLANRRAAVRRLQDEIARAGRYQVPLGLVLCRIDPCAQGPNDALAKQVGAAIRVSVREVDLAARWSTDTFLLILPHQPLDGTAVVARRIRSRVAALPLGTDEEPVTVSVGASSLRKGEAVVAFVERTHDALEQAAAAGGDRVQLSHPAYE